MEGGGAARKQTRKSRQDDGVVGSSRGGRARVRGRPHVRATRHRGGTRALKRRRRRERRTAGRDDRRRLATIASDV